MPVRIAWDQIPCLAFDTETTGTDPADARIVTAALVRVVPGQRPVSFNYVVDPGVDIPDEATAVHGYTRQRAAAEATHTVDQMLFEVTGQIAYALGRRIPVVVFNAPYDLTLLEVENHRHGVDDLASRFDRGYIDVAPIIDPMVLAKHHEPFRIRTVKDEHRQPILNEDGTTTKYCHRCECGATDWTLASTCLHYGVRHTGAHDAAGDALAAARLWPKILTKGGLTKFRGFELPGLHAHQVTWRAQQCDGLREYMDRVGAEHDGIPGGWPILHDVVAQARSKAVA